MFSTWSSEKLETVLDGILTRMVHARAVVHVCFRDLFLTHYFIVVVVVKKENQNERMQALESAVSANVLSKPYLALKKSVDDVIDSLSAKCAALEERVAAIDDIAVDIPKTTLKVNSCLEALSGKVFIQVTLTYRSST